MRWWYKCFLKCIAWSFGALKSKQDLLVYIYLQMEIDVHYDHILK